MTSVNGQENFKNTYRGYYTGDGTRGAQNFHRRFAKVEFNKDNKGYNLSMTLMGGLAPKVEFKIIKQIHPDDEKLYSVHTIFYLMTSNKTNGNVKIGISDNGDVYIPTGGRTYYFLGRNLYDAEMERKKNKEANKRYDEEKKNEIIGRSATTEEIDDGNYQLSGRKVLNKKKYAQGCNESGTVVVEIKVNRQGQVISANPGIKGTTNTSNCLMNPAKRAALTTKFNKDANAPSIQTGHIIYEFKLTD